MLKRLQISGRTASRGKAAARMAPGSLTVLLAAMACGAGAMACDAGAPAQTPAGDGGAGHASMATPPRSTAVQPAERLGPDDLVELDVANCPELSRSFRLSADGSLPLPLLARPLDAAGLTPSELSRELREALMKQNLLLDPVVVVSVLEYRSRPVSVMGAVMHPTTLQATGNMTLLSALATAGGLSPTAGGVILISTGSPSGATTVRSIPTADLLGGLAEANPPLHGGEDIRVPDGGKIFVAGNVNRPGMYPMQNDAETTVVKAVTLSAGLAPYSGNVAYIYRHRGAGANSEGEKIELARIMTHKAPDVTLHADDILYVPANDGKRLTVRVLTQIAGFGQNVGSYAIVR